MNNSSNWILLGGFPEKNRLNIYFNSKDQVITVCRVYMIYVIPDLFSFDKQAAKWKLR